jgi:hypothetical protein
MNVLAILPGYIPSTIIGVLRPLAELERRGEVKLRLRLSGISLFVSNEIDWCDVAVFCRNCEIKDLTALYELKRKGKKIVYEIDDNFEEIPLTTDIGIYHRSFLRLHALKRFFYLSNVTRVYSDRLLQRADSHGARTQLIRSYFDKSIIDRCRKPASDGVIRIAYPTGRIDDAEFEDRIFSAMRIILEKYAGKVEFHLWRKTVPKKLSSVQGVVLNKGVKGYDNFIRSFFLIGFDIGLAPGIDTPFFHSKTNNKYREFGGCGIAGIYSNFLPYSSSVIDEHSGLLAGNSTSEWATTIERLILDGNLRARIVKNAATDVLSNYSFESAIESWRECFLKLKGSELSTPEWLPLPSSKKWPIFALVHLGRVKNTDRRPEFLLSACQGIHSALLERFASAEEYLKSSFRRICCTSLFLVDDENGLEILCQLITLSKSAIVDLTAYRGNLDNVFHDLRIFSSIVPISYLVTSEQVKASKLIAALPEYVMTIDIQPSPIVQEFSLAGYPATYLELLERHIRHAPLKKSSGILARLLSKIKVLSERYALWIGRLETFSILIKWRLGLRRF